MIRNGADNTTDRDTGAYWENQFCRMARTSGKSFTPHQFKRPDNSALFYGPSSDIEGKSQWTLPDITIWSAPGEHHEIKHKRPTADGMYGLERYRIDALVRFANVTAQAVYYTIHDWDMAGAANSQERVENDLSHWLVGDIARLSKGCTRSGKADTWYAGSLRKDEPIWYWTADPTRKFAWFRPLAELWTAEVVADKHAA